MTFFETNISLVLSPLILKFWRRFLFLRTDAIYLPFITKAIVGTWIWINWIKMERCIGFCCFISIKIPTVGSRTCFVTKRQYVQKELYNFFLRFDLHFTQARLHNLKTDVNFKETQYKLRFRSCIKQIKSIRRKRMMIEFSQFWKVSLSG